MGTGLKTSSLTLKEKWVSFKGFLKFCGALKMKKFLIALVFTSVSAAAHENIGEGLIDILEFESNTPVTSQERLMLLEDIDCVQLEECKEVSISNVDARYCISRCTGTGKDRVCYEVCYED